MQFFCRDAKARSNAMAQKQEMLDEITKLESSDILQKSAKEAAEPDVLSSVTRFVTFGYDLIKGNPEGDFNLGGRDDGIKISYPVLQFTYDLGKDLFYMDSVVSVPDQVTFAPYDGCATETSNVVYSGAESYREELAVGVETTGMHFFFVVVVGGGRNA